MEHILEDLSVGQQPRYDLNGFPFPPAPQAKYFVVNGEGNLHPVDQHSLNEKEVYVPLHPKAADFDPVKFAETLAQGHERFDVIIPQIVNSCTGEKRVGFLARILN